MPTIEENLAAIAANSARTADALEALVKLMANPITTHVTNVVSEGQAPAEAVKATAGKVASGREKDKTTAPAEKPVEKPAEKPVEKPAEKPAPEPEADPLDEPEYTKDDVRAALKAYRDVEGAAAMMDILKQHGAEALADLKPEQFASVIAAVK